MKFRNYIKILFLSLSVAGMAGCVQEYGGGEIPTPSSGNQVTITVTVPGQQIPTTRSIADGGGEASIKTIDLLVFDEDGILSEHITGTAIAPVEGGENYKITFKAPLTASSESGTVVIIANAFTEVDDAEINIGDSKTTVLRLLTHRSEDKWNANSANVANPVDGTHYTPIPMYGEVAISEIENKVIKLTRMLARVDVVNSAGNFMIKEIHVVNYNTAGNIAPAWNTSTGAILEDTDPTHPYKNNQNPSVPNGGWGKQTGEKLTYTTTLVEGQSYSGEIYLYEAVKNPNNPMAENADHTNAICLVVKGEYKGTDYFYRIDFTGDNEGLTPDKVPYMPVYRNHLYTFDIKAVNGPGYLDFGDALESLGVLNNLKTRLHTIDMSGIKYMVFNGQHYIGLSQAEYGMIYRTREGNEVTILTNAKDLSATTTDTWIKNIDKGIAESISGGDSKYTLTFDVDVNNTHHDRKGKIILTAGRLRYELNVSQFRGCYPAYPGVIGYDPVIGDLNLEGRGYMVYFRFGSVVAVYAGLNSDSWSIDDVAFNPSDADCTSYENVPFGDGANEFPTHAPATTGKGDPCKLIGLTKEEMEDLTADAINQFDSGWRLPTGNPLENLGTSNVIDVDPTTEGNIEKYEWIADTPVVNGGYGNLGVLTLKGDAQTTYEGTTLTLPAAGHRAGNKVYFQGSSGYYWSGTPIPGGGLCATADSGGMNPKIELMGGPMFFSVRCVRP